MITVFLVDNSTRVMLPDSLWGLNVRQKLRAQGHTISLCADQTHDPDPRGDAERLRMAALLDATGL